MSQAEWDAVRQLAACGNKYQCTSEQADYVAGTLDNTLASVLNAEFGYSIAKTEKATVRPIRLRLLNWLWRDADYSPVYKRETAILSSSDLTHGEAHAILEFVIHSAAEACKAIKWWIEEHCPDLYRASRLPGLEKV